MNLSRYRENKIKLRNWNEKIEDQYGDYFHEKDLIFNRNNINTPELKASSTNAKTISTGNINDDEITFELNEDLEAGVVYEIEKYIA